ncbi:MAG: DNA topoisomerase IB [Synechococcales bacterium]|nr:DNA topoisomerase IB [Synechococcales bacterium]
MTATQSSINNQPSKVAQKLGLRYVSDQQPGIRRQKVGRGFSYFDVDGKRIQDKAERDRLKHLPIPPSWSDVWICPYENGHLQATGRDARGRKQYRYHPEWRQLRNQEKFERLLTFGRLLSSIREQTDAHLRMHGLPRQKVLALVVKLLEKTLIRVGNVEYARENDSYGLTTLRTRHVDIAGSQVEFEFTGKSGVEHHIELADRRLARVIQRCYEIPGYTLFQYIDEDGQRQQVDSGDVNEYLRELTGEDLTAKEFRTWGGTVLMALELGNAEPEVSKTAAKQQITAAIKVVAEQLGNRPATCRKYYVHPRIPEAYLEGDLVPLMASARQTIDHLERYECAVLDLIASWRPAV